MAKKLIFSVFAVAAIILPLGFAGAADFFPRDKQNTGNVVVAGPEEFRNLYTAGGTVVVNQNILGDLVAAGGSLNIAAPVEKDLIIAGGNITVTGQIGEDARVAGGNISINSPIGGDLIIAGGTISLSQNASIGGDLWVGGGAVNITGPVNGELKVGAGEVFINNVVTGPVDVRADTRLVFGPQARVQGPIKYSGISEAVVQDGAQVGQIEFTRIERVGGARRAAGIFGIFSILKIIAMFIAGLVIYRLFRGASLAIVSSAYNGFWQNLLYGIIGLIIIPIIAILLMITVIGFYLGILLMALFMLAILLGGVYTLMFIGALAEKWIRKKDFENMSWLIVLWGAIIGGILSLIPVLGWLAMAVLFIAVFGAVLRFGRGMGMLEAGK